MPYCMYLRKSRADLEAEARGEGETLARHERALLELARQKKISIDHIYREVKTGDSIAVRPEMQKLLAAVAEGEWTGALVMDIDRLARGDTMDQGIVASTFKYSATKIITPGKTYDPTNEFDEDYFEYGLFMSRNEYKAIRRRMQRGRVASVREGKFAGNRPPYGYGRKKLEHEKGFILVPNPDQAPIVKMIFDLYAHGERQQDGSMEKIGISRIVRKLNEMQIPPQRGKVWVNATLQQMMRNPVYIGKIRWNSRPVRKKMVGGEIVKERPRANPENWILSDGRHKPLIDRETWDTAQQRLGENPSHPAPRDREIKNPLAGLVVCGKCGRRMIRRPYTNKNYPDTLMCPATACDNVSCALDLVEDKILKALQQWLAEYRLSFGMQRKAPSANQSNMKGTLRAVQGELKKLEKQRNHIYDLLEQGVYTTDVFLERSRSVEEKISKASDSIKQITQNIEKEKRTKQSQKIIIPRTEQVLSEYPNAQTPAEKNELLKSVLDKVVYTKTVNGRWHGRPDDFDIVLYPKLPRQSY